MTRCRSMMRAKLNPRIGATLWALGLGFALGCASLGGWDPVTEDPAARNALHPARLVETKFGEPDARMNAIVYEAPGPGPHPTVVLLHGLPGNERNLDVAQAIRRAGWNVVFFHYRGAWGSEGLFTFGHVLEDVGTVLDAIAEPAFASKHRVDATRLALVGHSMGGFAALTVGAARDDVDCVASIAGANFGALAKQIVDAPVLAFRTAMLLESLSGPLNTVEGGQLVAEVVMQRDRFDTTQRAGALADKPLLLLAGRHDAVAPVDANHTPLVRALQDAGAKLLQSAVLPDADHAFSDTRVELARRIVHWLREDCGGRQVE